VWQPRGMPELDLGRFEPWFPKSELRLPPTDALLDEVEKSMKAKIPPDARDLVLRYGGAALSGVRFELPEGSPCGPSRVIEVVYGFGKPDYGYDLRDMRETYSDRIGKHLLPIAECAGGNQLCIDVERGDVLFWDHDCPRSREDVPAWALERLRRDLGSRAKDTSDEELREMWDEGSEDIPWWDCIYRVADSITAWAAGLQRKPEAARSPLEPRLAAILDQVRAGARYEVEQKTDGTAVIRVFRVDGARQLSMLRGDEWARLKTALAEDPPPPPAAPPVA
jgi:hypothetical protein